LKQTLTTLLLNARGFKSKRRIVVIESDDWGSVRMPSLKVFNQLVKQGIKVDRCGYNTYDSLETQDDLDAIFNTFSKLKDSNDNSPLITANTIVANPDFEKIRADNFQNYYYEPFNQSFTNYHGNNNIFKSIQQGIDQKMYFPQLHGREHVYIDNWLNALKAGDKDTKLAFDKNVYGLSTTISSSKRKSFLTALDFNNPDEIVGHESVLANAQEIFYAQFGFKSTSFIAPNYTWHLSHERILKKLGVDTIQGARAQKSPNSSDGYDIIKHYMGETNQFNQTYLVRNSSFEPSIRKNIDWQKKILNDVRLAFFVGAPVIISSHRVNFMGGLVESNRRENLKTLTIILGKLLKAYPDIEFMSSTELATLISKSRA
jgi:hypothetical protein